MTVVPPPQPEGIEPETPALSEAELFMEYGNRHLWKNRGFTRDEFLPQLRGQRAAQVFKEMSENDAVVGAVLFAIEMILRRVEWEVEEGGDEETEGDTERADFIASCMTDMSHSWEDLISDILTFMPYGFSYLEVVYKQRVGPAEKDPTRRSHYSDGLIGWRKFMLIPQDTITQFNFDDFGGVQSVEQYTPAGRAVIPIEKAALFRTTKRWPTGRSVLRNAYLDWYHKKRIEEIEGIGIERDLAGLPVMYLDPTILADATRRTQYEDIARNIRRDEQEGVLLPALYDESGNKMVELELLTAGGSRQFDTDAIITRHARYITMSLLQDVVMMGHEKVGTQALASEKRDLSDTALSAWLGEIASVLNTHLIPRLLELNGMDMENPPQLVPGDLRQEDILGFTEAIKNVALAGFGISEDTEVENFIRRRLGLPLVDEEERAMAQQMEAQREETAMAQQMALAQARTNGGGGQLPPQFQDQ